MPSEREAVVIGAGPGGLSVAATLGLAGVDAVVLERAGTVGSAWRTHYERLHLHTVRWLSHLPGHPIPRRFGRWVSRDKVISYLEGYARHHRLDIRFDTTVERIEREDGRWRVCTDGGDVLAAYVVVATGHNHTPVIPDWPGLEGFTGDLVHSKDYRDGERYHGRDVLVVGSGNTGAEIAIELCEAGAARVRLSVRTPPHMVPRDAVGLPGQVVGIAVRRLPPAVGDRIIRVNQRVFIGDLSEHGLPLPDEGVYTHLLRTGGVPILDIGLARLVREGKVEVVAAVEALDGAEVVLADGSRIAPDAVIAATGFRRGLEPLIGHLGLIGDHGRPVVHGPYTHPDAPRLHFIGFSDPISGMFRELNLDAWKIARAIAADRDGPPANVTRRPGPLGDRARAKA
ncbi:MAG: flavin-containing monooxygenase, partial [Thermoleophilaceae bacterium]